MYRRSKHFVLVLIISLVLIGVVLIRLTEKSVLLPSISFSTLLTTDCVNASQRQERCQCEPSEEFSVTQKERKWRIYEACRRYNYTGILPRNVFKHVLVNEEHRILYCYIPKVACTSWKKLFLQLSGETNNSTKFSRNFVHGTNKILKSLLRYNWKSVREKIVHYRSLVFVRDPFERLLSAYLDKFANGKNKQFPRRYGPAIVSSARNVSVLKLSKDRKISFPEFVKYVVRTAKRGAALDEHWERYHKLCSPCTMSYDFIGQFETIDKDSSMILRILGVADKVEFLPRPSRTSSYLKRYFSQVDRNDLRQLWEVYEMDYALWGYPKPSYIDL